MIGYKQACELLADLRQFNYKFSKINEIGRPLQESLHKNKNSRNHKSEQLLVLFLFICTHISFKPQLHTHTHTK